MLALTYTTNCMLILAFFFSLWKLIFKKRKRIDEKLGKLYLRRERKRDKGGYMVMKVSYGDFFGSVLTNLLIVMFILYLF